MTQPDNPFDDMRRTLVPKGSLPLVKLQLRNYGFVDHDLVKRAIDELEKKVAITAALGGAPSALETLGIMLLSDSLSHSK